MANHEANQCKEKRGEKGNDAFSLPEKKSNTTDKGKREREVFPRGVFYREGERKVLLPFGERGKVVKN